MPEDKIQYMFVKNNSNKTEAFRFGWKHLAMDPDGNIVNVDKVGANNVPRYQRADDLVRFSPRRTVLKPGETQRISFIFRRSPKFKDGEYRSHFLIQREPLNKFKEDDIESIEGISNSSTYNNEAKKQNISINNSSSVAVDVLVSRSVPIYVLNGKTNANLKIISAKVNNNSNINDHHHKKAIDFKVQRTGNRSVIGVVDVICRDNDQEVKINQISRVFAVYAEADTREGKISFDFPETGCSSIALKITGHRDDMLANDVLDVKKVDVN